MGSHAKHGHSTNRTRQPNAEVARPTSHRRTSESAPDPRPRSERIMNAAIKIASLKRTVAVGVALDASTYLPYGNPYDGTHMTSMATAGTLIGVYGMTKFVEWEPKFANWVERHLPSRRQTAAAAIAPIAMEPTGYRGAFEPAAVAPAPQPAAEAWPTETQYSVPGNWA